MSIFNELDYKKVVQIQVDANEGVYGYKSKLAEAAGCHKSFLSQVLNGAMDFTVDHAIALSNFWKFNSFETEYFVHLVQYARAGTPALRNFCRSKLESIRREAENLNRQYSKNTMDDQHAYIYYSTWYYSAIHILTTIPEYRTIPSIALKLQLPEEIVKRCLEDLTRMGLLQENAGQWNAANQSVHLSKDSFLAMINHGNWREFAMKNAFLRRESDLHYTAVHSCSRKDYDLIRSMVLTWIAQCRDVVAPSPEEELFCMTLDLFKV